MPNLCIDGAAKTQDFYKRAFSAVEIVRVDMPADKIWRAEIMISDSRIMFADLRLIRACAAVFIDPQLGAGPVGPVKQSAHRRTHAIRDEEELR